MPCESRWSCRRTDPAGGEKYLPVYRFAFTRLNRDPVTAEEVVQAALSRAVTKLDTYRGQAHALLDELGLSSTGESP